MVDVVDVADDPSFAGLLVVVVPLAERDGSVISMEGTDVVVGFGLGFDGLGFDGLVSGVVVEVVEPAVGEELTVTGTGLTLADVTDNDFVPGSGVRVTTFVSPAPPVSSDVDPRDEPSDPVTTMSMLSRRTAVTVSD